MADRNVAAPRSAGRPASDTLRASRSSKSRPRVNVTPSASKNPGHRVAVDHRFGDEAPAGIDRDALVPAAAAEQLRHREADLLDHWKGAKPVEQIAVEHVGLIAQILVSAMGGWTLCDDRRLMGHR
jgi:hypothetical protein